MQKKFTKHKSRNHLEAKKQEQISFRPRKNSKRKTNQKTGTVRNSNLEKLQELINET